MELNKCKRCGAFFASNDNVCPKCAPKDMMELQKLKCYLQENDLPSSVESLSYTTGISIQNLNRFLEEKKFKDIPSSFGNIDSSNFNIEL